MLSRSLSTCTEYLWGPLTTTEPKCLSVLALCNRMKSENFELGQQPYMLLRDPLLVLLGPAQAKPSSSIGPSRRNCLQALLHDDNHVSGWRYFKYKYSCFPSAQFNYRAYLLLQSLALQGHASCCFSKSLTVSMGMATAVTHWSFSTYCTCRSQNTSVHRFHPMWYRST